MSETLQRSGTGGAVDDGLCDRVWIGEWLADPETNELRRGDQRVRIEPKTMDVLMLLARRAGRVVGREELFASMWPGVVVGDEALTQTIIKLRKALGDNSRSPAYIETIAKRGYRLIAPVRSDEPPEAAAETDVPSPAQRVPKPRRRARFAGLITGAALVAALIGAYSFYSTPRTALESIDAEDGRSPSWIGVAIVPFESLSSDGDQAYLARGISDSLATDLSRIEGLRLIREVDASTSASTRSIARYRISGSVQRESGSLRINVHLVDTKTHEELWSHRFERPFDDLFAVQDEMIAKLVELLPAKVSDVERQRLAKRYTRSLGAYNEFLRGQALFLARGAEENEAARGFYRKALELDPQFGRAYAGLAMTYAMDARLRDSDPSAALEKALGLAETARQLDPDTPEVYWAMGFIQAQARRHDQAIETLQKAIALDRSFADAYALLGGILTYKGRPAESIPLLRTALRLNPGGGYLYFLLLGRAYLFEGETEQALIHLRAASSRNPADVETRVYLAAALVAAGDRSAAKWESNEIRALDPDFTMRHWLDTYPMTSDKHKERLLALLADVAP